MLPALLIALAFPGAKLPKLPLPSRAVITVKGPYADGADKTALEACRGFRITPGQVRARFSTFHVTSGEEFHSMYLWLPCGIRGSVRVNGKRFWWKAQPQGLLTTDYPDGRFKKLGGKYTDDPSDGESEEFRRHPEWFAPGVIEDPPKAPR